MGSVDSVLVIAVCFKSYIKNNISKSTNLNNLTSKTMSELENCKVTPMRVENRTFKHFSFNHYDINHLSMTESIQNKL